MRRYGSKPIGQENRFCSGFEVSGIANSPSKSRTLWPIHIGHPPTGWSINSSRPMQSIRRVGCSGYRSGCAPPNSQGRSKIAGRSSRSIAIATALALCSVKAIGLCKGPGLPKNASWKQLGSIPIAGQTNFAPKDDPHVGARHASAGQARRLAHTTAIECKTL